MLPQPPTAAQPQHGAGVPCPTMSVITVALSATLLIQLGYFLWKVSAEHQPRIGHAKAGAVVLALATDWRWVGGLLCTIAGWLLFVQATAMGDISLVQPLMSAGDMVLVLLAVAFLGERLHTMEWLGVVATVLGAVALSWQAESTAQAQFSLGRLFVLIGLAGLAAAVLLLMGRRHPRSELFLAVVVGLCFGAGAALTKALTMRSVTADQSWLSWTVVLDPLLLAVVLANVFGLVLLQAAFQRGRAAVIVPLQLALANMLTVACGILVFAEQVTPLRAMGIALVVLGAVLLHVQPGQQQPA